MPRPNRQSWPGDGDVPSNPSGTAPTAEDVAKARTWVEDGDPVLGACGMAILASAGLLDGKPPPRQAEAKPKRPRSGPPSGPEPDWNQALSSEELEGLRECLKLPPRDRKRINAEKILRELGKLPDAAKEPGC